MMNVPDSIGCSPRQEVTALLQDFSAGHREALDRLLPLVYEELRDIARRHLGRERAGHTLDSVALVSEAYAKLVQQDVVTWQNRAHFFAIAARAMRTLLIDHARRHHAARRGGGYARIPFDDVAYLIGSEEAERLICLDDALERLARTNEEAGQVVECRYFGGLSLEEAAAALDLSYATARRRWRFAKVWLKHELQEAA